MPHPDQIQQFEQLVRAALARGISRRTLLRRGLALGLSLPSVLGVLAACAQQAPQAPSLPTAAIARADDPPAVPSPVQPSPVPPSPALAAELEVAATAAPLLASPSPIAPTRFAVIGDYGMQGEPVLAVSQLVRSWSPEFVITTGDNNYPDGELATIDANIGQYYHEFIHPYVGAYGAGAEQSRFFPVLGNHDWNTGTPQPCVDFCAMPGRYYSFAWGPVRFLMLDSMPGEPDGVYADSRQAGWLREQLVTAQEPWKLVVMHHPPFSSGHHGSSDWMQWPYAAWGASLVLAGHDHSYERLVVDGVPYIVNGLGGASRYAPGGEAGPGSQVFFNRAHGAMLVEATAQQLTLRFYALGGELVDEVRF